MGILQLDTFSFCYPEGKEDTLKNLSFQVEEGEFVLLTGLSGSGKTTLLRQCKPILAAHGTRKGKILFRGQPLQSLKQRESVTDIGFVQQDTENQVVTDKVWHELAFGLESLGMDTDTIRLRVGEIAGFFGMEHWFYKDIKELSGGQLQMVNLASILAMQPKLLLLDEPTSQLDPIAAGEFFQAVKRVSDELGITVILSEHRLGEVFSIADRILHLENGELTYDGTPRKFGESLAVDKKDILYSIPVPAQIYAGADLGGACPLTVGEGARWLPELDTKIVFDDKWIESSPRILLDHIFFKYEKNGPMILKDVNLKIYEGKVNCILGGNGAGKSTTLKVLSGMAEPLRGKVFDGKKRRKHKKELREGIAVVPQNPKSLFVKKTVKEELLELGDGSKEALEKGKEYAKIFDLMHILNHHPYDISGGEQQRLALAKVLMTDPKVLMLDEPTKGMDGAFKKIFAGIIEALITQGITLVIVSHDLEFCGNVADYCYLFFAGEVISEGPKRKFFSGNHFYTTEANKMCRKISPEIITIEESLEAIHRSS
ncbi:MAG: ATP-binding cassette domain-containing protein [Tissierellia bacterium]|nr:ATP-binding cassette domain-containing protein [Tissierellia bacterium]